MIERSVLQPCAMAQLVQQPAADCIESVRAARQDEPLRNQYQALIILLVFFAFEDE